MASSNKVRALTFHNAKRLISSRYSHRRRNDLSGLWCVAVGWRSFFYPHEHALRREDPNLGAHTALASFFHKTNELFRPVRRPNHRPRYSSYTERRSGHQHPHRRPHLQPIGRECVQPVGDSLCRRNNQGMCFFLSFRRRVTYAMNASGELQYIWPRWMPLYLNTPVGSGTSGSPTILGPFGRTWHRVVATARRSTLALMPAGRI
jgi:hypothetical protein